MKTGKPSADGEYNLAIPDTWEHVVRAHYGRVFCTALGQIGRRALAEEVAQETFIRAFERHHQFDGHGSLASWLHRIAVNLSRDVMRRENLRKHASLEQVRDNADGRPQPAEIAHRRHLCHVLKQELERMPQAMRRAFEHTVISGHSYKEAAQIEGVSEGTIASRVARTRSVLARKYAELAH